VLLSGSVLSAGETGRISSRTRYKHLDSLAESFVSYHIT
jgi:hypothetical protein